MNDPVDATALCSKNASVSIVVEWENTAHVEQSRTRAMLRALSEQVRGEIDQQNRKVQLIVGYDPQDALDDSIRNMIHQECSNVLQDVAFTLIAVPGATYYVLKNAAARKATGDLIVFVDCDVMPQAGWLQNILKPFNDNTIGVSQGATFVEPTNLLNTAFALAWLFPLKKRNGELSEENKVVANNIAFRRTVILTYPYPDLMTWRGQCTAQRLTLDKSGIGVFWCNSARTIHPFPAGFMAVVERAFLNGHDHITRYEMSGGSRGDWKATYWRWRSLLRRARARRKKMMGDLSLSKADGIVCDLVAMFYWSCALSSECMVHIAPKAWRKLLRQLPQPEAYSRSNDTESMS